MVCIRIIGFLAVMLIYSFLGSAPALAVCIEGVGPNNERMPCRSDSWRPSGGGGGGGGGTVYIPTPRDRANTKVREGNGYWDRRDWARAIEIYRQALAIDGSSSAARNNVNGAYINWGHDLKRAGDNSKAEWAYRNALAAGGEGLSGAYVGLGNIYWDWDRYDEAMAYYNKALALNPNDQYAFSNLIKLRNYLVREAERKRKNAAINKRNQTVDAAINAFNDGNYEAALSYFRDLLRVDPNDEWAQQGVGNALMSLGRYEEAIAAFRRAIKLGGKREWLEDSIERAMARQESVRWNAALSRAEARTGRSRIDALNELIARYPGEAAKLTLRVAETQLEIGDDGAYRRTLEAFVARGDDGSYSYREAKRLLGNFFIDRFNRVLNSENHGGRLKATRELRKVHGNEPKFDWVEADALIEMGRLDDGIALLRESIERYPDNARLRQDLAWHLYRHGDASEARIHAKRWLELNPGDKTALDILGRIESYDGSVRQFVYEKIFGIRLGDSVYDNVSQTLVAWWESEGKTSSAGEYVGQVTGKVAAWWEGDDAPPADDGDGVVAETGKKIAAWWKENGPGPSATASTPTKRARVKGAFGSLEPPTPIVGDPEENGRFRALGEKAFAATPEPLVRMTRTAVTAARETWQRAGIEGSVMARETGLEWVANRIPRANTLKSLIEKTSTVYNDYSNPLLAHYAHGMAGVEGAVKTQVGEADLDDQAFDKSSAKRAEAIRKMTDDLSRKSLEWGISGGVLPNGNKPDKRIHLGDKLVSYVEKVFRLDRLWAFNRSEEVDKWNAARRQ